MSYGIGCCKTPEVCYMGISNATWYLVLSVLSSILGGAILYYHLVDATAAIRNFASHASKILGIFIVARLISHIPGMYQCFFYYLAVAIVYYKLSGSYEETDNDETETPFYIHCCLTVAGIVIGFFEKYYRSFLPNGLIIDILVFAWSVRSKPQFMEQLNYYFGCDLEDYDERVKKIVRWVEYGITIFFAARNIGMMVYCTELIARPCKHYRLTIL